MDRHQTAYIPARTDGITQTHHCDALGSPSHTPDTVIHHLALHTAHTDARATAGTRAGRHVAHHSGAESGAGARAQRTRPTHQPVAYLRGPLPTGGGTRTDA